MTDPDPVAVKQALSELRDVSKEKRRTAVMKLGMLGGEEALLTLMTVVTNPNEDIIVRGRAALMLGKLGDARAVEPLILALDDHGYQTRLNAAEALGKIGAPHPRAIRALLRVIEADHDTVGEAARNALTKLGHGSQDEPDTPPGDVETETA